MDDLISRKAAIEAIRIPDDGCSNPSERNGIIFARVEARRAIQSIPSVPAVPLDKLCEWLSGYAEPPLDALTMCDNEFEAWKLTLTKVMEEESWR